MAEVPSTIKGPARRLSQDMASMGIGRLQQDVVVSRRGNAAEESRHDDMAQARCPP